jgi:hypothetical protein
MKKLMIMGGLLGFAIATGVGLAQHSSWSSILWRASVAALAAGHLLRWWGQVWINSLIQAHQVRLASAAAAESTTAIQPSK